MSEKVGKWILLRRVSILLRDKWPKCLSEKKQATTNGKPGMGRKYIDVQRLMPNVVNRSASLTLAVTVFQGSSLNGTFSKLTNRFYV